MIMTMTKVTLPGGDGVEVDYEVQPYRVSHLRTHLKTHSGEKAHKCSQCD